MRNIGSIGSAGDEDQAVSEFGIDEANIDGESEIKVFRRSMRVSWCLMEGLNVDFECPE